MLVKAIDCSVTVPALLFDPAFYLFDFIPSAGRSKFLVVDERLLDQAPFIDIRFEPLAQAQFWVDTAQLLELEGSHDIVRPAPVFVFHHAFVCSTLLARCLNQVDAFFSLKEPWILRRLADFRRGQPDAGSDPDWRRTFSGYIGLLCRSFRSGRVPLIKATNVASNLLEDILDFMPERPVLYLYSDLESFLLSNLKKPPETQQKMPSLAKSFLGDAGFATRFPQYGDASRLGFLQVCALVWAVSLYNTRAALERHPNARVKTLDAAVLLADLPGALDRVSRHFGHVPAPDELRQMTDASVVQTDSKDQRKSFDSARRRQESDRMKSRHDRELAEAEAWIAPLARELGLMDFLRAYRLDE
jgi:hypothetical protein